jgi:hypothetical protein
MQKVVVNNQQGNVFYTASYDQKSDRIYSSWYGNITIDEIKTGTEKYLEFTGETKCLNLINDTSLLIASCEATRKGWIAREWIQQLTEAGIKNVAFVVSADHLLSITSQLIELKSAGSVRINIEVFADIVEAISWMRAQIRKQEKLGVLASIHTKAVYV